MWAENNHQALGHPNPLIPQAGAIWNSDNSPPVLACKAFIESHGDFRNQAELDREWSALIQILMTTTLSEQEVLAVLSSGILQTPTGRAIAGLFEGAILRSVRPLGALPIGCLEEIIGVICHLPPGQWQAALGENLRFASGQNADGVARFIQSELDRSSALRDERIANKELISDAEWETLKELTKKGRQYIRSSDGKVDSSLLMLEDSHDLRPSSKDVYAQLEKFISRLEKGDVKRVRWTDRYVAEVKALRDQVKPDDEVIPGWLERIVGRSWLESLFDPPGSSSAPINSSTSAVRAPSSINDSRWLLSSLQRIERNADFYLNVNKSGPLIPDSFVGKLLYVCNLLDAIGCLRLNSSHISTARPLYAPVNLGAEGSGDEGPESASDNAILSMGRLERFASLVDEVLARIVNGLTPWNSAYAADLEEVVVMLMDLNAQVYRPTTEARISSMDVLKEQLGNWLHRMSENLLSSGIAVLSRMGDLVERNPRSAVAAFAVYMAVSNLYAFWSLPESEQTLEPLPALKNHSRAVQYSVVDNYIVEYMVGTFEALPDFAEAIQQRISESAYLDPADDPTLADDFEVLLQKFIPGSTNVTYGDCIDEDIALALLDADDEFEDDQASETTTDLSIPAQPQFNEVPESNRNKRSIYDGSVTDFNVEPSGNGKETPANVPVKWLIEAAQHSLDADILLQPGEVIAPGVTIEEGADKFINALADLQAMHDPLVFMSRIITESISSSDLPENIKSTIDFRTQFKVWYDSLILDNDIGSYIRVRNYRYQTFSLLELFAGQHMRAGLPNDNVRIDWPPSYTDSFRNGVSENNFESLYRSKVQEVASQPELKELWKLIKKTELEENLVRYMRSGNPTGLGKAIVINYLGGNIKARPFCIRKELFGEPDKVVNAVYLHHPDNDFGLFVFIGGKGAVIECPADFFDRRERSMQGFPQLREELFIRMSLKDRLSRGEGESVWGDAFSPHNPVPFDEVFKAKAAFHPIRFGSVMSDSALFDELYKRQTEKTVSDIDTMVSTRHERETDKLLAMLGDSFAMLSLVIGVPSGGAVLKGLALLLGLASSAMDFGRGLLNDNPQHADQHVANGLRGIIFQFASPFVSKVLGATFSQVIKSRIAALVIERLKSLGRISVGVIRHLPSYKSVPHVVILSVIKVPKWISPTIRSSSLIAQKLEKKFQNYGVIKLLGNLKNNPEVAQRLMDKTGTVYFAGAKDGYVYQGFVMRGDMRPTREVFEEGFKLRTPITDVKQVNGMNGGFGGGKDSLDPDGMGISTSAFYSDSGAGAFHYGGGKGGYTYLIDGRDMIGYDLYRNHHYASLNLSKIGFKPLEINYGKDIPGSKILGAYDAKGIFIPNPNAIASSIAQSVPNPLTSVVSFPKHLVTNDNFSSANSSQPLLQ